MREERKEKKKKKEEERGPARRGVEMRKERKEIGWGHVA
jgi:hypothetical protein